MINSELVDIVELTKRSRRGRKRKNSEFENQLIQNFEHEGDEYKKKRIKNNIAVRKSRDKARFHQELMQNKLIELVNDNKNQRRLINRINDDYDGMEKKYQAMQQRLENALKINVRLRQYIKVLPDQPCNLPI